MGSSTGLDDSLPGADDSGVELSVVMPCLNEAETLATCIHKALSFFAENDVRGEVIVADNGSEDGSREIARQAGARVVAIEQRGYGSALQGGIAAARGRYVIMGDADDSYDFLHLEGYLEQLRQGFDLVMGNRFKGGVAPGAMPPLHRYLGNPVLSGIGRLFFRSSIGDFHCGLRGFSKESVERLELQTTGMEFASEMVVKATLGGLRIAEVPTTLSPDGRTRPPHLRSWRDGWRHLRFLLLYSPRWLFLFPGLALLVIGAALGALILPGPRVIGGVTLDVNTLLYAGAAILVGYQSVMFAVFTKTYAIGIGLLPEDPRLTRLFRHVTLETGVVVGCLLTLVGVVGSLVAVGQWNAESFGPLDVSRVQRVVIPSVIALALGLETILASFFMSVLGLRRRGGGFG